MSRNVSIWCLFILTMATPLAAQPLTCGTQLAGSISGAGEEDVLVLQATAGDTISLVLWQTGGSNFTVHGDLYPPSSTSTPILQDLNGENQIDLTESGTYILRVHDDNLAHTGNYAVEYNTIAPASNQCGVQAVSCGQNVTSTIAVTSEQHFYAIDAQAGDTISLVLWQTGGSNFTVHGDLYAPGGATVPLATDLNGENQIDVTQTGTYTLIVHASTFYYTGNYSLEFSTIAPLTNQCDVQAIACGENVASTIAATAEQHFYTFDAQAGDTMSLVLWQTGGSNFTVHGDLYGPGATTTPLAGDLNGENQFDITQTGTYTLGVHASTFYYTGNYSLEFNTIAPLANQCGVQAITCGENVASTIAATAEQHFYSLDAQAGDTISLVLWQTGGSNFTTHGDLYGPGATTALLADLNGENQIDVTQSGTYTLAVHASTYYYTGNYSLEFNTVAPVANQCAGQVIACGSNVSGSIAETGEQHIYSIDALAGDTISLQVQATGGSNFVAHGDLFEPGSTVPLVEDLSSVEEITLPIAGIYTLRVHASTYYYTGNYVIDLTWTGPFSQQCYDFIRGDASADGSVNLLDAILTLNYLFLGDAHPCPESLDSNDDSAVNLVDPVHTLNYLFAMGPAPGSPFPGCGLDGDPASSLGCDPAACP
ncbi:MAG: hypothetical protein AAF581_03905 [Planctomycetota bacterium]